MKSPEILEWVAFVPWSNPGVTDPVVTIPTRMDPGQPVRMAPGVVMGKGAVWFTLVNGTIVRLVADEPTVFRADSLGFGSVVDLVSMPDGGAVVLGGTSDNNRLVRMDTTGNILWEHQGAAHLPDEDPVALTGPAPRLVDGEDGTVFLLAASGERCAKLDEQTGHRTPVPLVPAVCGPAFLRNNHVYRVMMSDGVRTWAQTPLGTAETTFTVPKDNKIDLLSVRQATPDGGALLGNHQGFTWLKPDGSHVTVPLLSVVRNGKHPVGLLDTPEGLLVISPGQKPKRLPIDGPHIELVSASEGGFVVEQRDHGTGDASAKWIHFDRDGRKISITPPGSWLEQGGRIDWAKPIVEATGDILVVGTDSRGAYVVRVKRPVLP